jgi:NitT/TauT family transport system substrate-binding protein
MPTVNIQGSTSCGLGFFPLCLANDLGIFEKHGVRAKLVTIPTPQAVPAMQKGDLQFMATIGSAGRAIERGFPMKIVNVMVRRPGLVVVGGSSIKSLEDVRGKVISAGPGDDSSTQLTIADLNNHGLPLSSYEVLHTGTDQAARLAAVDSGNAQGTVLDLVQWLQLQNQLKSKGYTELLNTLNEIDLPYGGLAATTDYLKANPDVVRRTVAAVTEAAQRCATDKAAFVDVMGKELKVSPELAGQLFDQFKQVSVWQTDGRATAEGLQTLFLFDQEALLLDKRPTEEQLFDWSYLPVS